MCWEFELLILYIVLEKKSRSLDHSFLLLNHLVSSFLLGGLGFEGRTGRRARHASENIIVVLSVFFPRTMAWSWCLMGLASSQGQQDSLKLSRIIQLWNAPFSFTEYPKSQTKYGPKVLGFKEFSHVKSVLIFCSLNSLVEEKWPVEVTVSVLSVAGESGPNQPAAGGLLRFLMHHVLLHFCTFAHEPSLPRTSPFCLPPSQECSSTANSLKRSEFLASSVISELSLHTLIVSFYWPASHFGQWAAMGREHLLIILVLQDQHQARNK